MARGALESSAVAPRESDAVSLVVCGLAFEARIAAGAGLPTVCANGAQTLPIALDAALAARPSCKMLISFGTCGGLDWRLRPGQWIVADSIAGETVYPTDPNLADALAQALPGALRGVLAGVAAPVASVAHKRTLARVTGALGVDMESSLVARCAAQRGLRFAACRVVADPAERALPGAALVAFSPDGRIRLAPLLAHAVAHPGQLPGLLQLALDARAARRALLNGRAALRALR